MYKLFIAKDIHSKDFLINTLEKYYNIKNPEIIYNEYGKSYLKNTNLFFNISHTKNIVVLAVSDEEIGIDIEYLCYKPKLINKICTEEEKNKLNIIEDKTMFFTKMWVMKESYVKMIGQGITYDLKKVNTVLIEDKFDLIYDFEYIIAVSVKSNFD